MYILLLMGERLVPSFRNWVPMIIEIPESDEK